MLVLRSVKDNKPFEYRIVRAVLVRKSPSTQKKMDKNLLQKYRKTSFRDRPSDRSIVVPKRAPKSVSYSETVTCHCSSFQSHKKIKESAPDAETRSFSFGEMKRKLKHTFGVARNKPGELSTIDTSNRLPRNKHLENLDISSVGMSDKQASDANLEAKRHISARFENLNAVETVSSRSSSRTLGRILSSPEHHFGPLSPRMDGQRAQMRFNPCFSPLRPNTEVSSCDKYNENDGTLRMMDTKIMSPVPSAKYNGETDIVEMDDIPQWHKILDPQDSLGEREAFTSTTTDDFDFPSTPSSIHRLHATDCREEHRSPVSVLEPFSVEDSNSPPSVTFQNGKLKDGHLLKPRHLDFEPCPFFDSCTNDPPIDTNSCAQEQNHLSEEELLDSSLFDGVQFLPTNTNVRCGTLAELVIDEIMTGANFFTTLDQLVSRDVSKCRTWLDVRLDTQEIVVEIAEEFLEEFILDVLVEHCSFS